MTGDRLSASMLDKEDGSCMLLIVARCRWISGEGLQPAARLEFVKSRRQGYHFYPDPGCSLDYNYHGVFHWLRPWPLHVVTEMAHLTRLE